MNFIRKPLVLANIPDKNQKWYQKNLVAEVWLARRTSALPEETWSPGSPLCAAAPAISASHLRGALERLPRAAAHSCSPPSIQGLQLPSALLPSAGTCSNPPLVKATFSKARVLPNTSHKEKASVRRSPLPSQTFRKFTHSSHPSRHF